MVPSMQPARPFDPERDDKRELFDEMLSAIREWNLYGVCASRIGKRVRAVMIENPNDQSSIICAFNPVIVGESADEAVADEAFQGVKFRVSRPTFVRVRYEDMDGTVDTTVLDGLSSRIFHREVEYMHGFTIIDMMSSFQRKRALRKIAKWKRKNSRTG